MLEFSKLTLNDINRLRPFFQQGSARICNDTVGSVFMWREYFSMEYAICDDIAVFKAQVKHNNPFTAYSLPLGKNFRAGIDKVIEHCRAFGSPAAFYAVTDYDIETMRGIFDRYELYTEPDWSDYVYRASDLINLEGRKYSSKRNHINHFKKAYPNHSFEVITKSNISHVREFYVQLSSSLELLSDTAVEDCKITLEVLDNFELYDLQGGLLRVDDSVIAFSIGETGGNTLFVHIEKADMQYRGAYQVINNEFAKFFATEGIEYINREEDDGDPGLRFSKNSYHPCEIVDKYILVVI
jgi:hypothetical protein